MVFLTIDKHLFIKDTLNDSHIILTLGSVPEGLTNNLPLFFISSLAVLIAFLHLGELTIFLSFTLIFKSFGELIYTPQMFYWLTYLFLKQTMFLELLIGHRPW